MTNKQKALEALKRVEAWQNPVDGVKPMIPYDFFFATKKNNGFDGFLETIRAALEAPDLAEVVRDLADEIKATKGGADVLIKHAAAIAWAKEQKQ